MESFGVPKTQSTNRVKTVLKYSTIWLILSALFFGIGYLGYCYVVMSHGDINHDGIVDDRDSAIISNHITSKSTNSNYIELNAPTASTKNPTRTVHKPIIIQI